MESIINHPSEGSPRKNDMVIMPHTNYTNKEEFRSFDIGYLASDQTKTPMGMRDDAVLLSWLIVLLRTREDSQISFDWACQNWQNGTATGFEKCCISTEEVVPDLRKTVREVTASLSPHVAAALSGNGMSTTDPISLLLSTSSLSQDSAHTIDDGILHLETRFQDGRLDIRPTWWTENMLQYTITRYIANLVETIRLCLAHPNISVAELLRPTESDIDEIWRWNHKLPTLYNFCMHDMISERARSFPEKVAIASWDGNLTYGQVDRYSTFLAGCLKGMGVKLHDVLPVCFEKSRWTIVAVLAAMKSGATFVLMDPTLPLARLQNVATQVGAETMLTSRAQQELTTAIIPSERQIVVELDLFTNMPEEQEMLPLSVVPSSALMYMIFTSGSTGTPKGVKISHETYTSSAIPRAKAVGYTEDSRVLDFASYAFDVSIDSMLLTLGNGGCLCIPSDEDRLNDINEVIRGMRVNYAGLTPSVARILDPDVISSLSGLGLGGEAASARDVTTWGQDTRIIIGYGPCECTIGCTVNSSAATGRDYISIGPGNGAAIWVVDPNNHELLMPIGAVGELLVEGPIVGQGYLNDPEKTAAAFIEDPPWLTAGHKDYKGRRGRLYKTGDLGKYDPDGSGGIVFAGRKDTQVKLRGQRVELGEIESQLRAILPAEANVIVEVIVPQGSGGQPTLVAFVASQSPKGKENAEIRPAHLPDELHSRVSKANPELAKVLPRYMVPTAYIPVTYIPVLISGKIDRKRLRQFGTSVDLRQLEDESATAAPGRQLGELEQSLREVWGQVLKLDPETIQPGDNFFSLGGDSLAAMRLVAACRARSLDLSVVGTFNHPTLSGMAGVVQTRDLKAQTEALPFSMITQDVQSARLEASNICGSRPEDIQDIYPCTPTQESLFTFSLKSATAYVAQRVACIPVHISLDVWRSAWQAVIAEIPILRTRLAQLQDPGLQQVVLREEVPWTYSTNLAQYLDGDRNEKMNMGERLARYAIIDHPDEDKRYMVWTIHHVLYDGWSEPQILDQVNNALQGYPIEIHAQMRDFVKHVRETDELTMQEFWRRELKGAVGPQFPRLPSRDFLPTPDGMVERQIPLEASVGWPFTLATLIRGAWAVLSSKYTGSDDVVFGETLTGRDIPLSGVESIAGPLIATVPVRIHVHRAVTVESYLQTVQQTMVARTPYQHMGMQYIRKVSQDAQYACEAPAGLVIQPEPDSTASELGFHQGDVVREALHFNPYPLMLACGIQKGGFRVCASFDSSVIEETQMTRVLHQLQVVCSQLIKNLSMPVGEISCLPDAELNCIWSQNRLAPLAFDAPSRLLQADTRVKQGSDYPPVAVSWICDPHNSSLLSPIGCIGELWLEGNFLFGETLDSPPWLVAGSSTCRGRAGKLKATGDIVQLQDNGKLLFLGRKGDVMPEKGHAVNIVELESHVARHLPATVQAAVTMLPSLASSQHNFESGPVVLVECKPSAEGVELLTTEHDIMVDASPQKMTIRAKVPVKLVVGLKKLDKFIRDSLPSYMIPSTYIVIDKIPTTAGQVDRSLLRQLASSIPRQTLTQFDEGMRRAWTQSATRVSLSRSEAILQTSWAKILGVSPEKIDIDDNFFRLGGDSVLAMKLISHLRMQGHGLTVADIFQHMRLRDAAKVLKIGQGSATKSPSYRPFSTLGQTEVERFLSETVHPKLVDPSWLIQDVLPVTDSQALDVRATIRRPRTSIQYTMLYLGHGVDRDQLFRACQGLVDTHEILRTVFVEHGSTLFQVVVQALDVPVIAHHADGDLEKYVAGLCASHIESDFNLGSSFLSIFHVEADDGRGCLVIGLSHAQYDGISLPRLLRDLETLYLGQKIHDVEPFSSYVAHVQNVRAHTDTLQYWRSLLTGSTLSVLRGISGQVTDKAVFHTKPSGICKPPEEITTANLLTAAWALTLARRLGTGDVTFGGVTSGRNVDVANVEDVMGPCYQLTPIRVLFQPRWTAMDLLRFVQNQSGQSAAHDYLGFRAISQECTEWPSEMSSYDSLVHHQDFEDFDTMPFAGGTCRVEILNPHGDAVYPLKVVSFVRNGQIHVGMVGSERDTVLVDTVLDELVAAVQELATCSSETLNVLR